MSDSAYYYFKNLYSLCNEHIICVDENLSPVYMTEAFSAKFGYGNEDDTLLGCFVTKEFHGDIKRAIQRSKSISFDYNDLTCKELRKCIVIPTTVQGANYGSIIITELSRISFNGRILEDLRQQLYTSDENVRDKASLIMNYIKFIKNRYQIDFDLCTKIFNCAMEIRKEVTDIATLARKNVRPSNPFLLNANSYIRRHAGIATELLGSDRIDFKLDLSSNMICAETTYQTLDLLLSQIVCHLIKDSKGKAEIYISTIEGVENNAYLFSTNSILHERIRSLIDEEYAIIETDLPIISKLIEDNDGKLTYVLDNEYGKAVGFMLPKWVNRNLIFRQSEDLDETIDEHISNIAIQYSAFLDKNKDYSNYILGGIDI